MTFRLGLIGLALAFAQAASAQTGPVLIRSNGSARGMAMIG